MTAGTCAVASQLSVSQFVCDTSPWRAKDNKAWLSKRRNAVFHGFSELSSFARKCPFACNGILNSTTSRVARATEGDRKPWDEGEFLNKNIFVNDSSLSQTPEPVENEKKELVLVVGATGGIGKRVVDVLVQKGIAVRALVRNVDKAKYLLGSNMDLATADITQKATLLPEYFEGVTHIINAAAVTVGPKEGDSADRKKYYQGIKFYDPEIKGDSPEAVEYQGMRNLIEVAVEHLGSRHGKTIFGLTDDGMPIGSPWEPVDDVGMDGARLCSFEISCENENPVAAFRGNTNGRFVSIFSKTFMPQLDLSAYGGLELNLKGNGQRLNLIIHTASVRYSLSFDTADNNWQSIRLPFGSFCPLLGTPNIKDAPPLDTTKISSVQLMLSKFEDDGQLNPTIVPGPFEIFLSSIKTYLKEPIKPRFIHVSSAGVTRPDRPGLDLSKQPPAVRMNKDLGYILTFKLKGEDLLRESGIPYSIIRPCALTEEPAGAELIFEQGDNITGKIARAEVARIIVAALRSVAAADMTFEVKSTVPFSQPFTIDPSNPPSECDYETFFATLQKGLTGKEAVDKISV